MWNGSDPKHMRGGQTLHRNGNYKAYATHAEFKRWQSQRWQLRNGMVSKLVESASCASLGRAKTSLLSCYKTHGPLELAKKGRHIPTPYQEEEYRNARRSDAPLAITIGLWCARALVWL